jgi:hypothetical protein
VRQVTIGDFFDVLFPFPGPPKWLLGLLVLSVLTWLWLFLILLSNILLQEVHQAINFHLFIVALFFTLLAVH